LRRRFARQGLPHRGISSEKTSLLAFGLSFQEMEKKILEEALRKAAGNVSKPAACSRLHEIRSAIAGETPHLVVRTSPRILCRLSYGYDRHAVAALPSITRAGVRDIR
jgi:hypothetical protein